MMRTDTQPLVRVLHRLAGAFWRRRFLHWLIRAVWLALLVPTAVMAGYLYFDWRVPWHVWMVTMILVGLVSLAWSLRPINLRKMTQRLDELLEMRAQLMTAYEVTRTADDPSVDQNPVAEQLIQDAVRAAADLRRRVNLFGRGFWLELHTLAAVVALLSGMVIFDALNPRLPDAPEIELPQAGQEPQADEVIPPEPVLNPPPFRDPEVQTVSPQQVQAAMEALADALRDQAASRAVSDALDQGNIGEAAENLRRLSDRLEGLSESAQEGLGQSLQQAADDIGETIPNLTSSLEGGADALEQGNTPRASQAMEEIADTLDDLADGLKSPVEQAENQPAEPGAEEGAAGEVAEQQEEEGSGGDEGSGEGEGQDQPLAEEEERLPIDGEPLELESDAELEDRVLQPSELDAQASGLTSDSPFARQPLNAPAEDLGPDSLSYPWEKREIIRKYFSP